MDREHGVANEAYEGRGLKSKGNALHKRARRYSKRAAKAIVDAEVRNDGAAESTAEEGYQALFDVLVPNQDPGGK